MVWAAARRAATALRALLLALAVGGPAAADLTEPGDAPAARQGTGWSLLAPCARNCAVAVYGGFYVDDSMADVLLKRPETPFAWDYRKSDRLVALAVSRYAGTILGRVDIEPEVGIGQRFGRQDETEVWGAVFFRYRGFPWDAVVTTSVAISAGLNYASDVSEVENHRAHGDKGYRLQHYFSPEVTFALPGRPDAELMFRFHHRSGVYGLLNDARGGAHYGTVGLRLRF